MFSVPRSLGLVHVPFTDGELSKGWWIGERNQALQLHRLATKFSNSYSEVTSTWHSPNAWQYVSDFAEDPDEVNKILGELLAAGKISTGDERVILIDESKPYPATARKDGLHAEDSGRRRSGNNQT